MKILVTRINKEDELKVDLFKFQASPLVVSLSFWYQLIEPRYLINKDGFRSLWFKYTNSIKEICYREQFNPDVLMEYLTQWNVFKLESFLEKIWIKYKFIIKVD